MEQTLKPKTLGGFVRSVSGIFITKDNPNGLTPKECTLIAMLIAKVQKANVNVISKEMKIELANESNHTLQIVTNYINKFKKKSVINKEGGLHKIFFSTKVIIDGTNIL